MLKTRKTSNQHRIRKYPLHVKRLTVYLPADVDQQFRSRAKIEDRELSTLAERAFRAYLAMQA